MGHRLDWILRKDRDIDAPVIDLEEKVGNIWLKILVVFVACIVCLIAIWHYGFWNQLAVWTGFGFCFIELAIMGFYVGIGWLEKTSFKIKDRGGLETCILRKAPVKLNIDTDALAQSPFKTKWNIMDGDGKLLDTVERDYGFVVYRAGLSSVITKRRDAVYVVPYRMETIYDYKGKKHEVNYGALPWGDGIMANGKFHKYRYWEFVPEPFKDALKELYDFNHKKDRVRVIFFPEFDFATMDQLSAPAEIRKMLEAFTPHLEYYKKSGAAARQTFEEYMKSLAQKAKKGELDVSPQSGRDEGTSEGSGGRY